MKGGRKGEEEEKEEEEEGQRFQEISMQALQLVRAEKERKSLKQCPKERGEKERKKERQKQKKGEFVFLAERKKDAHLEHFPITHIANSFTLFSCWYALRFVECDVPLTRSPGPRKFLFSCISRIPSTVLQPSHSIVSRGHFHVLH